MSENQTYSAWITSQQEGYAPKRYKVKTERVAESEAKSALLRKAKQQNPGHKNFKIDSSIEKG